MSDPPGGADEPSDTRHEPRSDGAWSELVRATVADGFLAPPLQHDGPVIARRSMRRASAWSLRRMTRRRGSGTPHQQWGRLYWITFARRSAERHWTR